MAADIEWMAEKLQTAADVVTKSAITQEYRVAAFVEVLRVLISDPVRAVGVLRKSAGPGPTAMASLGKALGVEQDLLEMVFDAGGDGIALVISRSKLPAQKAPAMRAVTLLVAAGRQGAGQDPGWTSLGEARRTCQEIGVFDSSNFAAEVAKAGDAFVFRGRGQNREVKVTGHGYEEAAKLIRSFAPGQ